jgi:hypothetical protein
MTAVIGSNTRGLAFRVALWFARNPDEELTSADISTKWQDLKVRDVSSRLRKYRSDGILDCRENPTRCRSGAKELTWSAGPELLELIKC